MSTQFGGTLRADLALIDTSAVVALFDKHDTQHQKAKLFFSESSLAWAAVNLTAHETFTRLRYCADVALGLEGFDSLRKDLTVIDFQTEDESRARSMLTKYRDHKISHHDALCAAAMLRSRIYKVFTFDRDFQILGFQVIPGSFYDASHGFVSRAVERVEQIEGLRAGPARTAQLAQQRAREETVDAVLAGARVGGA